jgi:hypothetical protein
VFAVTTRSSGRSNTFEPSPPATGTGPMTASTTPGPRPCRRRGQQDRVAERAGSISNIKHLFAGWCPRLTDADTCVQRSLPRTDRRSVVARPPHAALRQARRRTFHAQPCQLPGRHAGLCKGKGIPIPRCPGIACLSRRLKPAVSLATLAAVHGGIPVVAPFFAPGEGATAPGAGLLGQGWLLMHHPGPVICGTATAAASTKATPIVPSSAESRS